MGDIFGFEVFEDNYFEQLCINHTNEIQYEDNTHIIDLIEGKMGCVDLLNEECVRPKGNDETFVYKLYVNNNDKTALTRERTFQKHQFSIQHYAGTVTYNAHHIVS